MSLCAWLLLPATWQKPCEWCMTSVMTTRFVRDRHHPRVGFIGGGFIAGVHSRAARSAGAVLVGVASVSPEDAQRAATDFGCETAYASAEELFADDSIDVVHICTPNVTHASLTMAALEAGKHVICEKPLATSVEDAQDLARGATAAGATAAVPFVYRYHPMVREARARVARGDVGTLLSIQGQYLQDWLLVPGAGDWRLDAAVVGPSRAFADIGSHLADLVEFVTGERIARLTAITSTVHRDGATRSVKATEDVVAVAMQTLGGAIGTLLVSQLAPGRKNDLALEISGTRQSLRFEQERPETLWVGQLAESRLLTRDVSDLTPDAARLSILPAGHPLGYQDAFNAFVADAYAAARGERPEGLPTFDDGLRAVMVTDAVLESAATGAWVDLASPPHTEALAS